MEISQREINSIPIIEIKGEVDLYNAKDLKDIIDVLIQKAKYKIVINLREVPFMDSSGIGTVVSSMYKLQKYGGNLKVANIHGSVAKVFKMTNINSSIEVYSSEDEAVNSFL